MTDRYHFHLTEETYREMLKESLRYVSFDRIDRTLFEFESIFYPLSVNEGKYAFLSYMEQMATAGAMPTDSELPEELTHDRGKRDAILSLANSLREQTGETIVNQVLATDTLPQSAERKNVETDSLVDFWETSAVRREITQYLYGSHLGEDLKTVEVREPVIPPVEGEVDLSNLLEESIETFSDDIKPIDDVEHHTNQKMLATIHDKWSFDIGDDTNLLLIEPHPDLRHSLFVPAEHGPNRLLLIASAGHGKSTFMRRLALYYCDVDNPSEAHQELQNMYMLSDNGNPIPCLIYLRNIDEDQMSKDDVLRAALADSVLNVVWTGLQVRYDKGEIDELPNQQQVFYAAEEWVDANADKLLLLMDGLDELSETGRRKLLYSLEHFLNEHPRVQIIITSRVAGLLESTATEEENPERVKAGMMNHLKRLHFRGRSITPLNDKSAEAYGIRWIQVTQPSTQQAILQEALRKVQTQRKFAYLKTFMRTPLELLSVLKQLTQDYISLNRCAMFHEMLWQLITNHASEEISKQALFDDTMTLLSFIAYHMQMKERLYLTREELLALEDDFGNLLFYTEIVGKDYAEMPRVLAYLDDLAANVGIIERDERTDIVSYTFPIRSYQEFLCAYACTHLVLEEDVSPVALLQKHLDNNHWWGIVIFALSELQENNREAFDVLIKSIFARNTQDELVRVVLESNPTLTTEQAMLFCDHFFNTSTLSLEQRDLIMACMETKSAYIYPYAVSALRQQKIKQDVTAYTEVLARMSVIQALGGQLISIEQLLLDIQTAASDVRLLAACMIYMLTASAVGLSLRPYMRQAREALAVSNDCEEVLRKALTSDDEQVATYCARALVLLRLYSGDIDKWREDNLEEAVRFLLYIAIDEMYTDLREKTALAGDITTIGGPLITLTDDLYVLGLLTMAMTEKEDLGPSELLYKNLLLVGCKRAGLLPEPLGQYIQDL